MEFPFFHIFSEFEKNIIKIYFEWKEHFPDATPHDFATEYQKDYQRFFYGYGLNPNAQFNPKIKIQIYDKISNESDNYEVYYWEFTSIIEKRLRLGISIAEPKRKQKFAKEIIQALLICNDPYNPSADIPFSNDGYIIDHETLFIYSRLFSYDFTHYETKNFLEITPDTYKNFKYSISRINKYLHQIIKRNSFESETVPTEIKSDEKIQTEELQVKQIQKIGLLFQSGIIDFLRSKYPMITNNQIAGFLDLISQEHLKQKSTNTHFTKDKNNPKYPIQNKQTEIALDLILSKFGMKNL